MILSRSIIEGCPWARRNRRFLETKGALIFFQGSERIALALPLHERTSRLDDFKRTGEPCVVFSNRFSAPHPPELIDYYLLVLWLGSSFARHTSSSDSWSPGRDTSTPPLSPSHHLNLYIEVDRAPEESLLESTLHASGSKTGQKDLHITMNEHTAEQTNLRTKPRLVRGYFLFSVSFTCASCSAVQAERSGGRQKPDFGINYRFSLFVQSFLH